MATVKRIGPGSAFKIGLVLYAARVTVVDILRRGTNFARATGKSCERYIAYLRQ